MIAKKKTFIETLKKNMGNVSATCEAIAKSTGSTFSRTTYYKWYNNDKEFREAVDAIGEYMIDLAENALYSKIKRGNLTATIFYLKTKGKGRGYVEKLQVEKPKDPVFQLVDARGTTPKDEDEDDDFEDDLDEPIEFEDDEDDE